MIFWGIDGCKAGWIAVGHSPTEGDRLCLIPKPERNHPDPLKAFLSSVRTTPVLIDMPIGLMDRPLASMKAAQLKHLRTSERERRLGRDCERLAREHLKGAASSVFNPPMRETLQAASYQQALALNRKALEGLKERGGISQQAWNITGKIAEVDRLLLPLARAGNPLPLREAHPELCFAKLGLEHPASQGKKGQPGRNARLDILRHHGMDAEPLLERERKPGAVTGAGERLLKKHAADDDLIDAMVLALTARIGHERGFRTLPESPSRDTENLPMEMVYALP